MFALIIMVSLVQTEVFLLGKEIIGLGLRCLVVGEWQTQCKLISISEVMEAIGMLRKITV